MEKEAKLGFGMEYLGRTRQPRQASNNILFNFPCKKEWDIPV